MENNLNIKATISGLQFIVDKLSSRKRPSKGDIEILEVAKAHLETLKQSQVKQTINSMPAYNHIREAIK